MKVKIRIDKFGIYIFIIAINSYAILPIQIRTAMQLGTVLSFYFIFRYYRRIKKSKSQYKLCILLFLLYLFFLSGWALYYYKNRLSLNNVLYMILTLYSWLLVFVYSENIDSNFYKELRAYIKNIGCITMVILSIHCVLASFSIRLLDSLHIVSRNGRVRLIDGTDFLLLTWFLSLSDIFKTEQNKKGYTVKDIFIAIGVPVYTFLFIQTRTVIIFELICIFISILVVLKFNARRIYWIIGACTVASIFWMIPSTQTYIVNMVESFNAVTDSSTANRLSEYKYYSELIKERWLFGYGPIAGEKLITLIRGPWYGFYPEDLGIYGYWFYYGVLAVVWYCIIFFIGLKNAWSEKHINPEKFYFKLYILCSLITMNVLEATRAPVLTLWIIIIEAKASGHKGAEHEKNMYKSNRIYTK